MKAIILIISALALTSCYRWRMPDKSNQYLDVLKKDGNLTRTRARIVNDLTIDPIQTDTITSTVKKVKTWGGKATIKTTIRLGVTIPAGSKGKIVEQEGEYFFVFKDKQYRDKVGMLPLNVKTAKEGGNDEIFIRTFSPSEKDKCRMIGTKFRVDGNDPGFELKIRVKEETESPKA